MDEIKSSYRFYHKKNFWLYRRAYKHFKQLNLLCYLSSACLVASRTIARGVTLNPIVLGTISGADIRRNKKLQVKNRAMLFFLHILRKNYRLICDPLWEANHMTIKIIWLSERFLMICVLLMTDGIWEHIHKIHLPITVLISSPISFCIPLQNCL